MKRIHPQILVLLILVFTLLCADGTWAQAPLEPAQMPPRTTFYVIWRGTPVGDARKSNSLLALWDDPDVAPLRAAALQNMQSSSDRDPSKPQLSREEIEQTSSLLENSFVFGYLRKPETKAAPAKSTDRPWNGMFFVYDRTGKELLLAKTVLRFRSQEKEPPQISTITVGGAPALKIERKDSVTYWTERGKYAVSSSELGVLEEILSRLDGKTPGSSLAQTAAYQEAQPLFHGGLLEFFLRVPQLKDLASAAPANSPVKIEPILDALKLESIHSLSGDVTLEGARARVKGAVLGDVAPGTLFDLWTDGQQAPASLSFVSPDVISYSEAQFNPSAFYDLLKRALRVALPQQQQGGAEMIEGLAASRIGMPLPDALALLSGDFASIQSNPAMDPQKAVYCVGIRNKPDTLKLLRTVFGDQLGSERTEGDATFVKVSLGGGQNSTGVAQWNFYHVAVTPSFVLASSRSETLREFLAKRSPGSPQTQTSLPATFQAARVQLPANLNGLTFMNFQKIDYQALKSRWIEQAKNPSAGAARRGTKASPESTGGQVPDWLLNMNPEVFPRHLHFLAGASWKDSKGVHFDEWLE
ncbi:MAG: hypothetical protein JWO71_4454 [Candidatus Acidoferrum typicum]|nr:hypothetical protein [Candidatus Acidoferrum typicum]